MMASNKLIAFNYFGGKNTWLDELYAHFPAKFTHLIDLFAGSLSVSLNYNGRAIKTANEINGQITNFFEVLRSDEAKLIRLLQLTPCSQKEYENCWDYHPDPLEQARRFYVRVRQSFFGLGAQRKNKSWHMAKSQLNAQGGETVSKWNNAVDKLYEVALAIRHDFQVTNLDYQTCIDKCDSEQAFFYCDPPYLKNVRSSYKDYKFEFSTADHVRLAEKLNKIKGLAMISGYESDLYDELYKGWNKATLGIKKNAIRSKKVKEVVWFNYDYPTKTLFT